MDRKEHTKTTLKNAKFTCMRLFYQQTIPLRYLGSAFFTDKEDGINNGFITWRFTSSCKSCTGKRSQLFRSFTTCCRRFFI